MNKSFCELQQKVNVLWNVFFSLFILGFIFKTELSMHFHEPYSNIADVLIAISFVYLLMMWLVSQCDGKIVRMLSVVAALVLTLLHLGHFLVHALGVHEEEFSLMVDVYDGVQILVGAALSVFSVKWMKKV
jgi:hypothetical protein